MLMMSYDETVYWCVLEWYFTTETFLFCRSKTFKRRSIGKILALIFWSKFDLFQILFHYAVLQQYYSTILLYIENNSSLYGNFDQNHGNFDQNRYQFLHCILGAEIHFKTVLDHLKSKFFSVGQPWWPTFFHIETC